MPESKETQYVRQLLKGKPVALNYMQATPQELRAIRKLWAEKLVRVANFCPQTVTAVFERAE